MNRIKGILYAAVSSSTFGLAPFFSLTLLLAGFSAFEVLSYRWGVATIALTLFGWCSGCSFRLEKKDFLVVLLLSLLRAVTSFSLLIAYQNIATGVASTIHFMYPLAVSLVMMYFFQEKKSLWVMFAVFMSLLGAEGLMKERRGRASKVNGIAKGRPPKLDKKIEEDLIAENQRLRMENEYLKKLSALVRKRMLKEEKKQQ